MTQESKKRASSYKKGGIDKPFLYTLFVLIGIGLLMVFSASMYKQTAEGGYGYSQFLKQSVFAVLGTILMLMLSFFNFKIWQNKYLTWGFFGITVFLLILVRFTPLGVEVNGAYRWFNLFGVQFQPSEICKVSGILLMASVLANNREIITEPSVQTTWELVYKCYLPIAVACGLILIEPSMSAAMAVGVAMLSVLWYANVPFKKLLIIILPIVIVGIFYLTQDFRLARIFTWFGRGETDYQISQSLLAFGSGGLTGVGLGNGKQKLLFLPEIQNDFIFANLAEEFGLLGCVVVLGLYAYLIFRGFQIGIAIKKKSEFGFLYTLSIMTLLGFQIIVNIAVATAIFPVTGMALPFISYGGTSIMILLVMMGPILNISRYVQLGRRKRVKTRKVKNTRRSRRNRRAYISGNSNIG